MAIHARSNGHERPGGGRYLKYRPPGRYFICRPPRSSGTPRRWPPGRDWGPDVRRHGLERELNTCQVRFPGPIHHAGARVEASRRRRRGLHRELPQQCRPPAIVAPHRRCGGRRELGEEAAHTKARRTRSAAARRPRAPTCVRSCRMPRPGLLGTMKNGNGNGNSRQGETIDWSWRRSEPRGGAMGSCPSGLSLRAA